MWKRKLKKRETKKLKQGRMRPWKFFSFHRSVFNRNWPKSVTVDPEPCSSDFQTVGPRLNLPRLKESFLRDLSIMLPLWHEQPPTYAAPHAHADVRDISKGLTDSLSLPLISCLLGGVTASRLARLNQPKQKCDAQRAFKNRQRPRL